MRKEHWLSNRDLMGETFFSIYLRVSFEQYLNQMLAYVKVIEGFGIVFPMIEEEIEKTKILNKRSINIGKKLIQTNGKTIKFYFGACEAAGNRLTLRFQEHEDMYNNLMEDILLNTSNVIYAEYIELDYYDWQNRTDIDQYTYKGSLKYTRDENRKKIVDISERPGKRGIYPMDEHVIFNGASKFWFGPDFYALQPKEAFLAFQDCIEVKDLGEKGVSVYLYPIYEGDEPLSQQRQWSLRKFLKVDEPRPYVETPEYIPKDKIEQFIDTEPSVLTAIHPGRHIVCVKTDVLATLVKDVFTEDVKIFRTNGIQAAEFVWKVSNGMAIQVNSSWCLLVLRNERLDLTKDSERAFYTDLLSEYEESYVFYVHEGHAVFGHLKKGIYQRLVYFMGYELKYESGPISKEEQELMETYDKKLSKKNPFRVLLEESNGKAWYLDDGFMEDLCATKCIDLRNPEQYGILDLAYITSYQPLIEPPTKPWWKFW